jgi:tetratricopeptide (TPR) repeat protein
LRNGAEALPLAKRAVEESHERLPEAMLAYAAAYAELGNFTPAQVWAEKALAVADERRQEDMAERAAYCIAKFSQNQPIRQSFKGIRGASTQPTQPATSPSLPP